MSQDNVDAVRRSNAAINRGDTDGALDAFHPDVQWRDFMHAPDAPEHVVAAAALGGGLPGSRGSRDPDIRARSQALRAR
jgi:hypothetical protein